MPEKKSILIIDDHPLFREGLKAIIERDSRFEVVGEAGNGREGLQMTKKLNPDMIIVDYPDILAPEIQGTLRDQENDKWAKLRGLSEMRHCLVLVGTQADAASYKKNWLHLDNFSEDKRKYGHVTAMIGLNQDPGGREKKLKMMRLNKLVVREEDFVSSEGIVVLQNLNRGQPYLSSFFP